MKFCWKYAGKFAGLTLLLIMAGCSEEPQESAPATAAPAETSEQQRRFDVNRIASGALLYQEHCAQCHGPEAQGHPDWMHAKERGYAAAPPLDGSGPATKLSKAKMIAIIKNGVKYQGTPVMPAWQGRVPDHDIEDVITWYQALWPSDVYARWSRLNGTKSDPQAKK